MNKALLACMITACASLFGGCASQQDVQQAREANSTTSSLLEECYENSRNLQASLDRVTQRNMELEQLYNDSEAKRAQLAGMIDQMGGRLGEIDDRLGGMRMFLPAELDQALRGLAEQYPGILSYDPATGLVTFAADLTFDSGSDVVKAEARTALSRLATIINSSDASAFDVDIEGHTDNVQPSRSREKFPTNRHLSLARSLSVHEVLRSNGVSAGRLKVSGWGEYRPVVSNRPGGTRENRRVDIRFVPSSAGLYANMGADGGSAPAAAPATGGARSTPPAEPFK